MAVTMATPAAFAFEAFTQTAAKPAKRSATAFTAQEPLGKQPGTTAHHPLAVRAVFIVAVRPSFVETHISPFDSMALRYIFGRN
jgi:hypothetical protein